MKIKRPAYAMGMIAMALFMVILSLAVRGSTGDLSLFELFYFYLLPSIPFLILAGLSQVRKIHHSGLVGAAWGAGIAIVGPLCLLLISVATYSGGGANIGIGLLLLAMPVYLPILMISGYFIGRRARPDR